MKRSRFDTECSCRSADKHWRVNNWLSIFANGWSRWEKKFPVAEDNRTTIIELSDWRNKLSMSCFSALTEIGTLLNMKRLHNDARTMTSMREGSDRLKYSFRCPFFDSKVPSNSGHEWNFCHETFFCSHSVRTQQKMRAFTLLTVAARDSKHRN